MVAAWREALLAQKVLAGKTRGYRHHPQLERFQSRKEPGRVMAAFLAGIAAEAKRRGYRFDASKILQPAFGGKMTETSGQLLYEWRHLLSKLRIRAPERHREFRSLKLPKAHPLFRIVPGEVKVWEKR